MPSEKSAVTRALDEWSDGDPDALHKLMPLVMQELRRIARRSLAGEVDNVTLDPTDLVQELYLRLKKKRTVQWENSRQFFNEMGRMIRHLLVEQVRHRRRLKRGGVGRANSLDEGFSIADTPSSMLEALAGALEKLAEINERQSLVVNLRYFVGLSEQEIADTLDISVRTVKRDWRLAKLWLYDQLKQS